jgi:hypothetical protein
MTLWEEVMSKWWTYIGVATLASACAIQGPTEEEKEEREPSPSGSDKPSGAQAPQPIIGGTPATAYPESALVNMVTAQGNAICSGAVIAPRVVLTAGHCVSGAITWTVSAPFAGDQSSSGDGIVFDYTDQTGQVNPNQHDVGLIILDNEIVLDSYPTLGADAVADGTMIVNIGRIDDGQASNDALFVSPPIGVSDAGALGFPYAYTSDQVIQPGDSGGPDMIEGTHTIVAVNSGAGSGIQILAKVNLVHDWIQEQIDLAGGPGEAGPGGEGPGGGGPGDGGPDDGPVDDPPADNCGGIPDSGACVGSVMTFCVGGDLMQIDCASWGMGCAAGAGGGLTCTF